MTKLTSSLSSSSQSSSDISEKSLTTIELPKNTQNHPRNQFYIHHDAGSAVKAYMIWINKYNIQHTATADNGSFESNLVSSDQNVKVVDRQGIKRHECANHPCTMATQYVSSASNVRGDAKIISTLKPTQPFLLLRWRLSPTEQHQKLYKYVIQVYKLR